MRFSKALALAPLALADPLQKYTLSAPDGSINATFIGYGARIQSLIVKDKNGDSRDIVTGFDDPADYVKNDRAAGYHNYFGPIVGRYANRIKNGTFTVDGVTSHIPENEHNGENTLHGGTIGYDQRNWTVEAHDSTSITFKLDDTGFEGFPGTLITYATYTLESNRWTSRIVSIPLDKPTPIMMANHVYWNLDSFTEKNILNNTLYMPYADRIIGIDGILIPTGELEAVAGGPFDFMTPKQLGKDILNSKQCGTGCVGIDNAFILDKPRYSNPEATDLPLLELSSPSTGIKMTMKSNQQGIQLYACNGMNSTIPVKQSQQHGAGKNYVNQYDCLVIEAQQWIDGINQPEWGNQGNGTLGEYQIYTPQSEPYVAYTTYDFSIVS